MSDGEDWGANFAGRAWRVGPSGSVVGCDLSEEMLSIAEAKGELGDVSIEYRQCPAEALRVDDDSFDVAVVGGGGPGTRR